MVLQVMQRSPRRLLAATLAALLLLLLRRLGQRRAARQRRQLVTVDPAIAARYPVGSRAARVAALHVFPVKSCRAQSVERCHLAPYGLQGDRELLIAELRPLLGWEQLTQRKCPRLALLDVRLSETSVTFTDGESQASITVTQSRAGQGLPAAVRLHAAKVDCECALSEADDDRLQQWLRQVLGLGDRRLRLFHVVAGGHEPELKKAPVVGRMYAQHDRMAFSDLAPMMFASTSSLESLNEHIAGGPVPMSRFRANVVLEGLPPWLEDLIQEVEINGARFRKVMDCTRCVIPTIDQETGKAGFVKSVRTAEPLATLKRIRPGSELLAWAGLGPLESGGVGGGLSPMFGCLMAFSDAAVTGELRVGDEVMITKLLDPARRRAWHCLW